MLCYFRINHLRSPLSEIAENWYQYKCKVEQNVTFYLEERETRQCRMIFIYPFLIRIFITCLFH